MPTASIALRTTAGELRELPRRSMITAAKAVKRIATEEGQPPFRKKRAVKLRAVDDIRTDAGLTRCRVKGVPVGLWVIRNTGAGPHDIPRARRGKAKPRYLAGRGYGHPVRTPPPIRHPGARGRGAWRAVVARATDVVPAIFVDDVDALLRR